MAKKALKQQAQQNTATLSRTHSIALGVNVTYLLLAFFVFKRRSLVKYILLNAPALLTEFWFERIARPSYNEDGSVRRAGEDLEAPGLTEWMWDVLYWSWGNVVFVAFAGDWAWWGMLVPVAYSLWLAFTTYTGMRKGFGGLMPGGQEGNTTANAGNVGGQSKRQAKLERRGGQKVTYR